MKAALKIVLIYIILGLLWIYFSDNLLLLIDPSGDLEANVYLQHYKGFVFVFLTGILLFFMIRKQHKLLENTIIELKLKEKNEKEFNLAEERFNAFAQYGEDMITMFDEKNNRIYASPNISRILGYSHEEFMHGVAFNFNHPEDARLMEDMKGFISSTSDIIFPFQLRLQHKKGHWLWVEGTIINLLNKEDVKAIISCFRDVTEKKFISNSMRQRDESLFLSNERYRLVSKATHDTIWDCDLVSNEIIWNSALKFNYGYSNDNTSLNVNWRNEMIHPEDRERVLNKLMNCINSGQEFWEDEYRFKASDGTYKYIIDRGFVVYDIHKCPRRMIGSMQDVTMLRHSQILMSELNVALEQRAAELAISNTELERFVYVASHDLQEPLRMVSSFLFLLKKKYEGSLDETGQQYIDFAVDASERMKRMILDLLEYSKVSGSVQDAFEEVDLNEIMQFMKMTFKSVGNEKQVDFEYKNLPVVKGNKIQLQQLFQNLISNGIKYSKHEVNPKIEINCLEHLDHWLFEVKDNGIGIQEQYLEQIFVVFHRLHGKSQYPGTGIGLATCKKIIEKHKGKIWAESIYGYGSTFKFTIPK